MGETNRFGRRLLLVLIGAFSGLLSGVGAQNGVPLAVEAARTTRLGDEYPEWSAAIHAVASSLEPTSVWSMWRTDSA